MSDAQEVAHASVTYATCLTAILAWDWLNYLPSEYKYLWGPLFRGDAHKRRRSHGEKALAYVSCGLFLVVRYFALLEFALFTWSINATVSHEQCQKFQGELENPCTRSSRGFKLTQTTQRYSPTCQT